MKCKYCKTIIKEGFYEGKKVMFEAVETDGVGNKYVVPKSRSELFIEWKPHTCGMEE